MSNEDELDPEKTISIINKKYGNYIIDAMHVRFKYVTTIRISSMQDLVKIAEKLEKFIIYLYEKDMDIHNYMVFDGCTVYTFKILIERRKELGD